MHFWKYQNLDLKNRNSNFWDIELVLKVVRFLKFSWTNF
jgi:hypothetical protein